MTRILILGGTGEALRLARELVAMPQYQITTSLAGRTRDPERPAGDVRIGGFGGASGLEQYLRSEGTDLLLNATHPFAAEISRNALAAHRATGIPLLRLLRPPWRKRPGDRWIMARDAGEAARLCAKRPGTVLLTLGVKELPRFRDVVGVRFVARVIEHPDPTILPGCSYIVGRGPFDLASEIDLMRAHDVRLMIAKQSGGDATRAKIDAARALSIDVIMIDRPRVEGESDCPVCPDVACAMDWVRGQGRDVGKDR